ncbi:MAG: CheR family methyltransferase, partial [Deltaproteobacteria bacterium]
MIQSFLLADKDYLCFRDLIQERTGMLIGDARRNVLSRTLKENTKHSGCKDINEYLSCLETARTDSDLWDNLIKGLTISETYFFRHPEQIEALRKNILPDLIARHWTDRALYLWSAGCATGEEPYTLAILLRQLLPDIERWRILILATDIDRQALARAASARYREWSFRETDPAVRESYFTRKGDRFTLDPSIQKMVTFAYLNLAEDTYPSHANYTSHLDLILCRNVSIYLPHDVIHGIADRFHKCLSTGGWLMLGPSETHLEIYSKFQMLVFYSSIVYQKFGSSTSPGLQTGGLKHVVSTPPLKMPPKIVSPTAPLPVINASPSAARTIKQEVPAIKADTDLLKQGEMFVKQRRYDDARKSFLACLAKEPGSVEAQYRMACLEANAGRLDEARKWAEQTLEGNPLHSEAHYILAIIHQSQGNIEEATGRLKKVIYLDPDFILAHFSIFHLYERNGKRDEAERHRFTAIRLASRLSPDTILPGSDDLTAAQMLTMARTVLQTPDSALRGNQWQNKNI